MLFPAFVALGSLSSPVICIDPGHPSEMGWGTSGKKLTELEVCWRVANDASTILRKAGYRVVLTKKAMREKVTNRERAEVANRASAALMVRLHCDAGAGSGFAVYYPDRQGKHGTKVGPSKEVLAASALAARAFHAGFSTVLKGKLASRGILTDRATLVGSRHGALIGSIYSEVPAVLVEMCKLQNAKDEAFFLKGGGFHLMAKAVASGVQRAVPVNERG